MQKAYGAATTQSGEIIEVDGQEGFFRYRLTHETNLRLARISEIGNFSGLKIGDTVSVVLIDDSVMEISLKEA